jgi:hypothetical protein
MKRKIAVLIVTAFASLYCSGQHSFLSVLNLPDSLKQNASVIKLEEQIHFEVTDIDRAYLRVHKVFTVTSVAGKSALLFNEYSNRVLELVDAEIKVYDAMGKQVNRYKKKDMFTTAVGEGLVEDGYVTYFEVNASSYPITVEFNYEQKFKGTLFYPQYDIQSSAESVLQSTFTAKVPAELDLRFKEKNIHLQPVTAQVDRYKTYTWSVKNLPALQYEEGAVSRSSRYPAIILAPNQFKIYDVEGDMSSWEKFGAWEYELIRGLEKLPEERKIFFNNLVKDAKEPREKAKLLYGYLQKNFRYVSIQLGIGGYKPFPAVFTDQKKYGDCKALSFYMYAALDAVGIKSYIALINAEYNKEAVDPSFPCNQFNHMILCIPQPTDSIWLECTSKTNDFGVLGSFTENRNALLITEHGGQLVPTPASKSSDNIFVSKTVVQVAEDGGGMLKTGIAVKGEYKQDFIHQLFEEKSDDQKTFLVNYIRYKQPDFFSVSKKEDGDNMFADIELEYEKVAEFTAGSKVFLSTRMYKLYSFDLPNADNRRLDYYFQHPFEKTDTTIYKLPAGYIKDVLPGEKNISCGDASFTSRCWYDEKENAVYSAAKLVLLKNKIPADRYAGVKAFFDDVKKYNAGHIVVKKN